MIFRVKSFLKRKIYKIYYIRSLKNIKKNQSGISKKNVDDIKFSIDFMSKGKVATALEIEGWMYSQASLFELVVEFNGCIVKSFRPDLMRLDVCSVFSEIDKDVKTGFKLQLPVDGKYFNSRGATKVELFYVVGGSKKMLASSFVFNEESYVQTGPKKKEIFYFTVASSNISLGGFGDFKEKLSPFSIGYCQLGFMAPVLYMRSTLGAQSDWQFDSDFDATTKQINNKLVVADSLIDILNYSKKFKIPCLIGLNGGIWSDAAGSCPEWDLTDHLEEDIDNCQWNQRDEVMPDDYLKHLTGAESAPELSRALTLNHYNKTVRAYKKRNLQQAGKVIAEFARENPELYIGTNLDPDCYQNPFFEGEQWYDFNPASLQQFRDWLAASGVYANELRNTIKHIPYSLDSLNAYLGTTFTCWDNVEPPRDRICKLWNTEDKFLSLWEKFRRHLVQRHYSDLASWLSDVGISRNVIYSSQGFTAPQFSFEPFALSLNSPVKNYDSGGMSLEGSKPDRGHIGAILYGESARNNIRTENRLSFFENILKLDSDWAVVEFNPADLRDPPKVLPDYGFAWECLREIFNHQARLVNLMAWNGSTAHDIDKDHFNAHMALRDTPLEQAVIDFMLVHSDVPRGSVCYSFGSNKFASTDNWTSRDTELTATAQGLKVKVEGAESFTLYAPQISLYRGKKRLLIEILGTVEGVLTLSAAVNSQSIVLQEVKNTHRAEMSIYEYDILSDVSDTANTFTLEFRFSRLLAKELLINRIVFLK
ncbi:MAG: hypothetical protein PHR66_05895 [Desulfuromonadaceae bacterium]|nr:hypothetical protein [Desulfuromonadaceae bacterium]